MHIGASLRRRRARPRLLSRTSLLARRPVKGVEVPGEPVSRTCLSWEVIAVAAASYPPALSESSEAHVGLCRAIRDLVGPNGRPAKPWRAAGRRVRVASEWRERSTNLSTSDGRNLPLLSSFKFVSGAAGGPRPPPGSLPRQNGEQRFINSSPLPIPPPGEARDTIRQPVSLDIPPFEWFEHGFSKGPSFLIRVPVSELFTLASTRLRESHVGSLGRAGFHPVLGAQLPVRPHAHSSVCDSVVVNTDRLSLKFMIASRSE